ncbi:type II toxin-antitoxin system HipA family toxin [Povalibacter sp.]|uniref:type II toxin-antitoxin system HipA family toxin n=1 Tax=Povalibacter sp. TaxID=1962978 RepID=UPI002F3FEAF1
MTQLLVVIEGEIAGRVDSNKHGLLRFSYEPAWLESKHAFPLSTSMPLTEIEYKQSLIAPFLWNLLPENEHTLEALATAHGLKSVNPFRLMLKIGEDVPGAAQFVPDEHIDKYLGDSQPEIAWISMEDLDDRIRILNKDAASMRLKKDVGRISLAGAQTKTSFYFDGERWGVPFGRTPNTHILKPAIPGYPAICENEHLCLSVAARCGLPAARSTVLNLPEPVIAVERFDRLWTSEGVLTRVHEEDFCQALSLMPARKYQEHGGPGIRTCVELLRRVSTQPDRDVEIFLKANMFNWFVGGMDAHAKNYSLLISAGEVRLAPLYDLACLALYQEQGIRQELSMKVGEHYAVRRIGLADWQSVAKDCRIDEDQVLAWLHELGEKLPDHVRDASKEALNDKLNDAAVTSVREALLDHIEARVGSIKTRTY